MGKRKPRTRVKSDNQPAKPAPQDSGRTRVFKPFFQPILLLAFFVSGATSLSLEVAWSKQLSYLLGVDVYAATTVVTAFMFGLGLGAFLVSKYYRWPRISIKSYGYLQVAIGISGLISIPMLRSTGPLFSFLFVQFQFNTHIFLIMRFLCVFALIVIPIMLMGMTLPIVVGASFGKAQSDYARLAGRLYGVNTVGAVCGTLAAGFFLVPKIGILKTCLFTGALDLLIGLIIVAFTASIPEGWSKGEATSTIKKIVAAKNTAPFGRTLSTVFISWSGTVFFVSGIVALAYEIIWFRLLARIIGPSVHAFSIMLAVYLLGIGSGSIAGAHLVRKNANHRLIMSVVLLLIGLGPLSSLFFINNLPVWYGNLFIAFSSEILTLHSIVAQGLISALLILPATIALGAFFPLITKVYNVEITSKQIPVEGSVGRLYFYNTIGGVIGSLLAGFWLIPLIGIRLSIIFAGFINIFLALAVLNMATGITRRSKAVWSMLAIALSLGAALVSPRLDQKMLNSGLYSEMLNKDQFQLRTDRRQQKLGDLIYFKEGINNSVAIVANKFNDGNLTLHLSGSWVSSTEFHGRFHLEFLGHLPMLFARKTETVGVIGYGAGITTGNILLYPGVKSVNVFELEPGVLEASPYFEMINNRPMEDSRTNLYMVDGRSHITYGGIRYDVITSDPIHPFVAGSANLYTVDFYEVIKSRLNKGGILCQWIPLAAISEDAYNTILNTMHAVFPHLALFSFFGESVVIASSEPLQIDWRELEERFYSPPVYEDMLALDFNTPFNLIAFFMGAEGQLDDYLENVHQVNTDDNVWLEHRIPHDVYNATQENLYFRLRAKIGEDNQQSLMQIFPNLPADILETELAGLSKNGDWSFTEAEVARIKGDYLTMEKYYREAFLDFNSKYAYNAGLKLAAYLRSVGRYEEAFDVIKSLQKNYPAFPEAYLIESQILLKNGSKEEARKALSMGLRYNPSSHELKKQVGFL